MTLPPSRTGLRGAINDQGVSQYQVSVKLSFRSDDETTPGHNGHMQTILVLANRTAVGTQVTQHLFELKQSDPDLSVVVALPATPEPTAA